MRRAGDRRPAGVRCPLRLDHHQLDDDHDHDDGGAAINHYCVHVDHEHDVVYVYDHAGHGAHDLLVDHEHCAALNDIARAIAHDRATRLAGD